MVFDENLKAITQSHLMPKVVDTILAGNVIALRVLSRVKEWRGETLDRSVQVTALTAGGSFSGLDKFDTNTENTKARLSFSPKGVYQPIIISGFEQAVNASAERSAELVAEAIEESANELADKVGTMLNSDGTGNSSKDIQGLDAIVDDGTGTATYGGQSRSTYSSLASTQTAVGGSLTLATMAAAWDAAEVGSDAPNLVYTTPTIWSDYEALAQPSIGINQDALRGTLTANSFEKGSGQNADLGFTALVYRGAPIVKDEKCTSGRMYFLNERHLSFFRLPHPELQSIAMGGNSSIEGVYSDAGRVSALQWTGFLKPIDQLAKIAHLVLMGEFVSFNPNRHSVLTGIS